MARVGGILAPALPPLSQMWTPLPMLVFGTACIGASVASGMLPETLGKPLPESLQQITEELYSGRRSQGCLFFGRRYIELEEEPCGQSAKQTDAHASEDSSNPAPTVLGSAQATFE